MLRPEDFISSAAYVEAVKALLDPPAHPDDPSMADEHAALFALVPRNEATHVAVKSGSWFEPTTWADGQIPTAGAKVLIPEAISVNYDSESDASLFTVRVDGKLLFAPDHDTRMVVDTLVVAKTGLLQIGSNEHPIQDGITAKIVIADNGPIDVNWDPLLLSRGIISHGATDIHGQQKTSFLKLALDPVAGSSILFFNEDAAKNGWHVGDKIVVAATHIDPQLVNASAPESEPQDEVRFIKAIYGSTVVLDEPLKYNHDAPQADLKGYVADYTRNVVIETQNSEDVPVSQRGHVMFMHSPAVDVEYAELDGLGRTDKSVRAVDAETATGITSDTNVKGRYALHLHETGVEPDSPQAIIKGNAVWGSPGWGIVQHASSADIENNATFDTFGAAYVAETGNETGAWINNIAIQAHGIGVGPWFDKEASDVEAFDLARTGIGFYFQGRMIKTTGNVAADVNEGFVYMTRGSPADILADDLAQPDILHGLPSSDVAAAPIQNFTDNEVFASGYGFIVIKANPYQEHDVRSVIDGFKAWETGVGMNLQYTAHYTILNSDFVGPANAGNAIGIELGANTYDIVLDDDSFSNLKNGVVLDKDGSIASIVQNGNFGYVFIDLQTQNITGAAIANLDLNHDRVLSSSQLSSGPATLHLNVSWDNIPVWNFTWPTGPKVVLSGTKTDSLGTVSYTMSGETFVIAEQQMQGLLTNQGYYTTDDGRKIVVLEEYYADRVTGEIFKTSFPIQIADIALVPGPNWLNDAPAKSLGRIDLNAVAPVAHADSASTSSAKSVMIDVLGNDVDPSGLAMTVDGITQPTHGTVAKNSDGTLTYTPDSEFTGVEKFKYWVTDQNAKFAEATVTVQVSASEETPGGSHGGGGGAPSDPPVVVGPGTPPPGDPTTPPPVDPTSPPPGHLGGHAGGHAGGHHGGHTGDHHGDHTGGHAGGHTGGHAGGHTGGLDPNIVVSFDMSYRVNMQPSDSFEGEAGRFHSPAFAAETLKSLSIRDGSLLPWISINYDKDFGATTEPGSQFGLSDRVSYAVDKSVWTSNPGTNDFTLPAARLDLHPILSEGAQEAFDFKNFDIGSLTHLEGTPLPEPEHHTLVASGFFFS